ncbi:type II secretion system protein J [Candidatus Omnitrophota bacterium]
MLHGSRALNKGRRGFSLTEVLVAALLTGVIVSALLMVLTSAQLSDTIGSARVDLHAETRSVVDMVARDVRRAISWDIVNNLPDPLPDPPEDAAKLRFNLWALDIDTHQIVLTDQWIEYDYDSNLKRLTRIIVDQGGNILESRDFNDITEAPFYTTYTPSLKKLDGGDLNSDEKLIIVISKEKVARGRTLTHTLILEVKIRNG